MYESYLFKMKIINTPQAPSAIGPYSQGVSAGNLVFFSGQIALTPEGDFLDTDVSGQTKQVLKNIAALLDAAQLEKNKVVKTTVFLSDINDFAVVNDIYADFFGDHKPARSCVEVSKLPKGAKVEIEIIAHKS